MIKTFVQPDLMTNFFLMNTPIRARPILTARHRAARLLLAQRHLHWTRRQWHNVFFSDESRFSVSQADGRVRVYRRRNEKCSMLRQGTG